MYVLILLFCVPLYTEYLHTHTRTVSPGFVEQIMPNTFPLPIDITTA